MAAALSIPATRAWRALAVGGLLGAGLAIQLHFLNSFPQPILFGDPQGYYATGQRFLEAWTRLQAGEPLGEVYSSVRGLFFLLGVGSLFAVVDAVRPGDLAFFRYVLTGFNTAALLGAYLLARRLAKDERAGLLALALGALYPALSVQTGRLYPDPVTACCFVWASWMYLEGVTRRRAAWLVGAGLALGVAALVRSQLALYLLVVLPLALVASAPFWLRAEGGRRLAAAFALSLAPLAFAWAGIERAVGDRDDVIRRGNLTFRPPYPYGFWQFLDADGWSSAYRFHREPYYLAMRAEDEREPGLLSSRQRMLAFTARYVAARPGESVGVVLNNVYRLLDRPANDYKWDYPIPYPAQVAVQRAVAVLALAALALFASEALAALGVFFVPGSLVVLHGLMFVWPRYNVPMMPILIAAAAAATVRVATSPALVPALRGRPLRRLSLGAAAALGAAAVLGGSAPALARWLSLAGVLAGLALPFVLVRAASTGRRPRAWATAGFLALAVVVAAHAWRDRLWHERTITLGRAIAGVEQRISLSAEAVARLRDAAEAFVVFDLSVPRGDTRGLALEIGGQALPGSALLPTMPYLPESTSTGGRDWRGYPQWWAVPLDATRLPPAGGVLTVRLTARAGEARLRADRFAGQELTYEGPSFGERPNVVALKLEYDGDYRLPVSYGLGSMGTRTSWLAADGRPRPAREMARVRVVTLRRNEGRTTWRTAPAPAERSAFGFLAWSGRRGQAALRIDGKPALQVPLDREDDWLVEAPPWTLCRRSLGERSEVPYGAFVLSGPAGKGRSLELDVSFRTGMSDRPMLFIVEPRRGLADVEPYFGACGVGGLPRAAGVAEVTDAARNAYPDDTGYWTVREVF